MKDGNQALFDGGQLSFDEPFRSVITGAVDKTLADPTDPVVGVTLGRYAVLGRIAKGGTATVYRAIDNVLNREVALKILLAHLEEKREIVERFKKEAQAIAQLRHPNVVTAFDFFAHEGKTVVVVEYVPGNTLSTLIKDPQAMPEEFVIMVGLEILQGLRAAHQKGMIHRDIKPANILVHPELGIKISDFGLAKFTNVDDGLTKEGIFVGTPSFSSPEQIEGKPVDARSDLFSLGLSLYMLATKSHAFKSQGDSTTTVWFKIVKGKFKSIREMNPNLSRELDRILDKSLEVDILKRYQSADEMIRDLEDLLRRRKLLPYGERLKEYLRAPTPGSVGFGLSEKAKSHLKYWVLGFFLIALVVAAIQRDQIKSLFMPAPVPKVETKPVDVSPPPPEAKREEPVTPAPAPVVEPTPAPQKPTEKPKAPVMVSIPSAISISREARVVGTAPGLRFSFDGTGEFVLAADPEFRKVLKKYTSAAEHVDFAELKPGRYHWKGEGFEYGLQLESFESYREQNRITKRSLSVTGDFSDVDLEINPWLQDLTLNWESGPRAETYRLEVASDAQFHDLIFSGNLLQKSQKLERNWEKNQSVFWRVSYFDKSGSAFLIDPPKRINLKVKGNVPFTDILFPRSGDILTGDHVTVRAMVAVPQELSCASVIKGRPPSAFVKLKAQGSYWAADLSLPRYANWIVCRSDSAPKESLIFSIPIRRE